MATMNPYDVDPYFAGSGAQAPASKYGATPNWWDQNQVNSWYQQYLGRPEVNPDAGTDGNYGMEHYGLGSLENVRNFIYNSDEGKAYRARQTQAQPTAPASSPVTGDGMPNAATQFATSYNQQAQAYPQQYQQERERIPLYQGFNYNVAAPQYTAPSSPQVETGVQSLVEKLLANPYSMDANQVAMLKEKQKEDALFMLQQQLQPMQHQALMRGTNFAPLQQQAQQGFTENLLGSYRDIDLAKMAQDKQDEYTALGAGSAFLGDQLARASQNFGNQLAGSQFDLARQQAMQQDALARWQSQAASTGEWNDTSATAAQLSAQSLSQQLAMQEFLEGIRQFNAGQQNQFSLQQFLANRFPLGS